jgi:hypothetical protein
MNIYTLKKELEKVKSDYNNALKKVFHYLELRDDGMSEKYIAVQLNKYTAKTQLLDRERNRLIEEISKKELLFKKV